MDLGDHKFPPDTVILHSNKHTIMDYRAYERAQSNEQGSCGAAL